MIYKVPFTGLLAGDQNSTYAANSMVITGTGGNVLVNTNVYVDSSGNVGIGTNMPLDKLNVYGNIRITNAPTNTGIVFPDGTLQTTAFVGAATPSFGAPGTVQIASAGNTFSGNSDSFFWDSANNRLGIGTNSPTNVLTVRSTATPAWFNTINSAIGTNNFEILVGNSTSTGVTLGYVNNTLVPYGYLSAGSATRNLTIAANGRVGVGGVTAPQVTLDVGGGTVVGASWAGNSNFINPPANGLAVQGSVGVGTYTPLSTLDVRGTVGVTGAANFGGAVSVASMTSNGAVSGTTGTFGAGLQSGAATVASLTSNGTITGTNYLITTASSTAASGVAIQRVFSKTVSATQLYKLAEYSNTEGIVAIEIQVASQTSANSGTTTYRFQGGYSSLAGSYYRLMPFNDGRGHGEGQDTGFSTLAWEVYIYGTTVSGGPTTYGVAVSVPTGAVTKTLITTITELRRGMTFTDRSADAVVTSFTNSGTIYSHRNLLVESEIGIGTSNPLSALDVRGGIGATSASNFGGAVSVASMTSNGAIAGTTGTFSGDVTIADKIVHTSDTDTAIRFPAADTFTVETAGSERLRVDSSGNVGIATTTVATGFRLQVEGAARANQLSSGNGTVTSPSYTFFNDNNTGMYISEPDTLSFTTNGTIASSFTSTGDLRLYNTAGTFYSQFSNQPTANRTLTIPDIAGTLSIIQSAATAGYFDTSTTTPTGTTRLNYGGYFYPTALNLVGTSDTTTAATHYLVETSTDGFIRPKTLANVQSEIVTTATVNAAAATTVGTVTSGVWNAGAVTSSSTIQAAGTATVNALVSNGAITGTTGTFTGIQNSGQTRSTEFVSNTWIHATQNLTVASSNASTTTATGAAVITGGVGIGGRLNVGGAAWFASTLNAGGAFIAQSINSNTNVVGVNLQSTGTATVNALVSNTSVQTATVNASSSIVGANIFSNGFVQAAGTVRAQSIESNTTVTAGTGLTVTSGGVSITGASQFTGNVNIAGNLNVTGTISTQNANVLVVQDPIIYLGEGNTGTNWDLGLVANYNDGTYEHTGFVRNHVTGVWTLFDTLPTEPNVATGNVDWSNSSLTYAAFLVGNVNVAGQTDSISTTTGALRVTGQGGVGIGGRLNVGGASWFASTLNAGGAFVAQSINSNTNVVATNVQSTGQATVASLVSNGAVSGTTGTFTGALFGSNFNTAGTATVNALVSNGAISGTTITGTSGTFTSIQNSSQTRSAEIVSNTWIHATQNLTVASSNASTTTATGAAVITGGVGIGGRLNVGGAAWFASTLNAGSAFIAQSINSNTNVVATNIQSTGQATVASLVSNGAVSGTTGTFTGALYGANFNTAGTATVNALVSNGAITGTTITGTAATFTSSQNSGNERADSIASNTWIHATQNLTVASSNESTSSSTGAAVIAGGVGIGGNLNVDGTRSAFTGFVSVGAAVVPNYALDVTGEVAIRGGEGIDDARLYFQASDNSNRFIVETDLDATSANDLLGFRSTTIDNILMLKGDGTVGIGTIPTVGWSTARVLELPAGGIASFVSGMVYAQNSYFDGSVWRYRTTSTSLRYAQAVGEHRWFSAPSGGAGNVVTATQHMTLDIDGKLGIGTTIPTNVLTVRSTITPAFFNTINSAVGTNNFEIIVGNNTSTGTTVGYVNNTLVPYGYVSTGTTTRNIVVAANGRVGIGGITAPQVLLDVGGGAVIGGAWAGNTNFINPPTNGLAVQGSVGVGTYTPLSTLDVRGGVGVTGTANFGGAVSVASLTSNGAVSGTTGTFTGALFGSNFNTSGTATVNALVSNGAISSTTGTFTGIQNSGQTRSAEFVSNTWIHATQNLTVASSNASTTTATGAAVITGGVGIGGRLNVGGASWFASTLNAGGAFVAQSINSNTNVVGVNLQSTGTATVNALTSNGAISGTTGTFSGNVGIATTSVTPGFRLHVDGAARANQLSSGNGTVSSPSYTFFNDTNTGMYISDVDTLSFATNGTIASSFTSTGDLRLYNTAGTFYSQFSNQPTANRTLTIPDVAGTLSIIQTAATAGYFDTSTTTPTATTRLNYGGNFYPTALNLVGTGDTATAATHYFVETGTDGFVRPKTLANVQSEIVTTAAVNAAAATTVGTITSGTWQATDIGLAYGGTNASLSAVNGGVVYSTTTALAITAAGTSGQVLVSAGANPPAFATLTLENLPDAWVKRTVKVATTTNITLSGTQTIDGVAVAAGDRVLVKNQTASAENGIYVASATAWSRAADANAASEIAAAQVAVDQGNNNGGTTWDTDFKSTDTLGTTAMTWYLVLDSGKLVTAGATTTTAAINYNGTTSAAGQFDGGTTNPTGNIRLNYGGNFYPTALNLVGTVDTTAAATHYFVETGTDGFVRPKTLANVQSEIVTTAAVNAAAATTVGTVTSGVWNAGAVTSSSTIQAAGTATVNALVSNGAITGTTGTFTGIQNSGNERAANIVSNTWIHATQNLTVASSNASTTTATGAAVITGGVGIGGRLNVGGASWFASTLNAGGAFVAQSINSNTNVVGVNLQSTGTATVNALTSNGAISGTTGTFTGALFGSNFNTSGTATVNALVSNGAISGTTGTFTGAASLFGDDGTNGYVRISRGTAANPGYVEFFTADDVRRGFLGWQSGTNRLLITGENGWIWRLTGQLESTVATGTAPFAVTSTTTVTNLSADTVDGIQASSFLRSDANDIATGFIEFDRTVGDAAFGIISGTVAAGNPGFYFEKTAATSLTISGWNGTATEGTITFSNSIGLGITPATTLNNGKGIAFGDADTGIRQNGDGVLEFYANDVEMLQLTNSAVSIATNSTGTVSVSIATGATTSGNTKTVNIGTGGGTGSTTSITIGDADGGTTTVNSPSLVVPGNMTVGSTVLPTTGPILTLGTLTSGGTGYMNGTHTNQALSGTTGSLGRATITVAAGVITDITLTWGGHRFTAGEALILGGSGSLSTTLATTATSGTGTTATITFAAQAAAPFQVGSQIIVAGVTPTGYNGTFTVTGCTTTTVSYASTTTGAQTVAGTVKMGAPLTTAAITVGTVQGTDVYVSSYTSDSIGSRIRLEANDTGLTAGQEYGAIVFASRDNDVQGSGDLGLIKGVSAGTQGGSEIEFWTGANGTAPTKSAVITSGGNFRMFNSAGTFYTELSNSPTSNVTIVVPNITTAGTNTMAVFRAAAAAGQFDTSTTAPTGSTRLNYSGHFYPAALNLVSTVDTTAAATHYFVETGTDGFVRPKTLANVQSEIVTTATVNAAAATTVGTVTSGVWNAGALTTSGNITITSVSGVLIHNTTNTRDKLRVWNTDNFTIGMDTGYTFGSLTNDYAMTFQMNNSNARGWWWGDAAHTNAQGAMSLSTQGHLSIASAIRVGYGESDTTKAGTNGTLDVSGNINVTGSITGGIVATQSEAETGTDNTHIMTPLRVAQAITNQKVIYQEFTESGTWTKPAGVKVVLVECIGGGGSGGAARGSNRHASGGGGGGYSIAILNANHLTSTVTVTVGLGGASVVRTTDGVATGNTGGNSRFGSAGTAAYVLAYGGAGGIGAASTIATGGAAGTALDASTEIAGGEGGGSRSATLLGRATAGGGGANVEFNEAFLGATAVLSGSFGGDGSRNTSGGTTGGSGMQSGGGGGAAGTSGTVTSGPGGDGLVKIWAW